LFFPQAGTPSHFRSQPCHPRLFSKHPPLVLCPPVNVSPQPPSFLLPVPPPLAHDKRANLFDSLERSIFFSPFCCVGRVFCFGTLFFRMGACCCPPFLALGSHSFGRLLPPIFWPFVFLGDGLFSGGLVHFLHDFGQRFSCDPYFFSPTPFLKIIFKTRVPPPGLDDIVDFNLLFFLYYGSSP